MDTIAIFAVVSITVATIQCAKFVLAKYDWHKVYVVGGFALIWAVMLTTLMIVRVLPRWRLDNAAHVGDFAVVKRIIEENPELVHASSINGVTALFWAVSDDRLEIVEYLIDHGARMGSDVSGPGPTPFGRAASEGHYKCVELMLQRGVDVNTRSLGHGNTALHLAVMRDRVEIARLLIDNGADVNLKPLFGEPVTPLRDARSKEMIELLRKHGAK